VQRPTRPQHVPRTLNRATCSRGTCGQRYGWAAVVTDAAAAGAGQVPVRSVDAYFFQGRSISNGDSIRTGGV